MEAKISNPYDCSTCDNEDCSGCGEHAYESGYMAGIKEVVEWVERNSWQFEDIERKMFEKEWQAFLKKYDL